MKRYVRVFQEHEDYSNFTRTEDFILPNVSYCKDQTDIVHYNPYVAPVETRVIVTYNTAGCHLFNWRNGSMEAIDIFDKIEIDGEEVNVNTIDNNSGYYGFGMSASEHTVAYTLKDPTAIREFLFDVALYGERTTIINVFIPNSVTTIGENAFSDCTSLTTVTLGSGVQTIGENAFSDCTSLTSVDIPNSVTTIGQGAFSDCTSLTTVTLGSSVQTIGNYAFCGCPLDAISKETIEAINTDATSCGGGPR